MSGSPETDLLLLKPIDQYRQSYERAKSWKGGCSDPRGYINLKEYIYAAITAHKNGIQYLESFPGKLPSPTDPAESLPDPRQENVIAISKKDMDDFRSVIAGLAEIETELKEISLGKKLKVIQLPKLPDFLGGFTAIDFSTNVLKGSYDKLHEAVYAQAPGEKVTLTLCCRAVCGAIFGATACAAATLGVICIVGSIFQGGAPPVNTPQDNCLTNACCFCCSGTGFASYDTYACCDKQAPERNCCSFTGAFFSCKENDRHDTPVGVEIPTQARMG